MSHPGPDVLPREATERVGRVLRGKWRLDDVLDVGGMATVYSATHRNGGRAAIKILHADRSCLPEVARRFLREGYVANAVGHPGVVRALDDDVDESGAVFLVMELLDGAPLHLHAAGKGGRLPAAEVLAVCDQVLDVLAVAHARGILHRDIKPENIFVTRTGQTKLLDFGIARSPSPYGASTTQNGAPLGTPAFMPPEQARGRFDLVGPQSDLWALGATMFTLLTGEVLHHGETPTELLAASMSRHARSLASVLPGAHPYVVHLVDKALARESADRWTDAREMQRALRRASSALATFGSQPTSQVPRRSLPRGLPRGVPGRPRDWALAFAAAVVSFAGVTALASAMGLP
ncbi:MAG TPA: serine/threonine-protein kinase [Polyangiaceae bacterium]